MTHFNTRFATLLLGLALLAAFMAPCAKADEAPAVRSLTLADAIKLVGQTNLSVMQAREDAIIADAAARSSRAIVKPTVSATTYASEGDRGNILTSSPGVQPQNIFAAPSRGFADINVTAMAPLYTGGRLSGIVERGKLQSAAANSGVDAAVLTAQSDVTQAYSHALLTQELAKVAAATVDAEQAQVTVTQEKVDAGHAAPFDLLREQAELADAKQEQLSADNNSSAALIDLKTVLGLDYDAQISLADTLDTALGRPASLPNSLTEAIADAIRMRPELRAAIAQVDAAGANIHAAQGAYSPQVYGVGMADAGTTDGGAGSGFTVGVTVSLPLYDAGQRSADVDSARAKQARSKTDAAKLRQAIEQQVSIAWLNLQTAQSQVDAANAGVAAAMEGYRLADLRYNAGKSTTAERLDALAARTTAEGKFAEAKAAVVTARGMLLAGIGASTGQ